MAQEALLCAIILFPTSHALLSYFYSTRESAFLFPENGSSKNDALSWVIESSLQVGGVRNCTLSRRPLGSHLQRHWDIYGAPHSIPVRILSPNICVREFELGVQERL